jgi:hypothetical protein
MNKPPVRHLSALLVVLGLAFVAPSSADTRPLAAPPMRAETGWMPAMAGWLASLFSATRATVAGSTLRSISGAGWTEPPATSGVGTVHTNTGSCVDPNGHPAPCSPG